MRSSPEPPGHQGAAAPTSCQHAGLPAGPLLPPRFKGQPGSRRIGPVEPQCPSRQDARGAATRWGGAAAAGSVMASPASSACLCRRFAAFGVGPNRWVRLMDMTVISRLLPLSGWRPPSPGPPGRPLPPGRSFPATERPLGYLAVGVSHSSRKAVASCLRGGQRLACCIVCQPVCLPRRPAAHGG